MVMDGYEGALAVLPERIRRQAAQVPGGQRDRTAEFRLRRGRFPALVLPEGERRLEGCGPVGREDLERVLELATEASPYATEESIRQGFVTAAGGVRVGVCGQFRGGGGGIGTVTSVSVRVPRQILGCAGRWAGQAFVSTLLISPPGGGKTTLLRDYVRLLSDGGARVALCDERGEVAGFCRGEAGFDVGERTDVMTGCPKHQGALMLLRAMNPEILAMDEITAPEDVAACAQAANCGVRLLATAHGDGPEDLAARPLYRPLLEQGIFSRAIVIRRQGRERTYREAAL